MQTNTIIEVDGNTIELHVPSREAVIVERHLAGHTKRDLEISRLPIPSKPLWLKTMVRAIRFYQKRWSHRLGNRCVFDPSCSHYAEIAFREKGFFKGMIFTIQRLRRCRPSNGGIDELK